MKIFWSFARQNFHALAAYRFDFLLRASSIVILMYGIRWLWITLYTQRPGAFGLTLQQMVTYGVLSMAIQNLFFTGPPYYMARQVRTGAIDLDLLKPLDFHYHMLARSTGEMLFRVFVLALPGMLVGYFLFDLQLPANSQTGFLFVVAVLLGYLVNFHLDFLLGLLAFVSIEIHSIDWAFHATARFFSGQFVPVGFFPGLLGVLAAVLPFRSVFFIPLSIYNGALQGSTIVQAMGFQLVWLTILWILSRGLWGRIQTRVVSQGG
jgi:viologen exporter family transport system permease protein